MIFIVDGTVKIVSFVMRSKTPWNIFVPLDNPTFGVQFLAGASVALYIALERYFADGTTLPRNGSVCSQQ